LGSELRVLLEVEKEKLLEACGEEKLVDAIMLNRQGKIEVKPGFDGEYGIPKLGAKNIEKESDVKQKKLGEY